MTEKESFTPEDLSLVKKRMGEFLTSLSKELKSPEPPVLFAIWEVANLILRSLNKDYPQFEIPEHMNKINIHHIKLLKEEDE